MADVRIRASEPADLAFTRDLLAAEGLPVDDLAIEYLALSAEVDGELRGVIGLEAFEGTGLLRSLVVSQNARGFGLGGTLVAALEAYASGRGIRELWLLTIDADPFFAGLGYVVEQRDNAPDAIQQTREFSGLCPGDAVLMRKTLA